MKILLTLAVSMALASSPGFSNQKDAEASERKSASKQAAKKSEDEAEAKPAKDAAEPAAGKEKRKEKAVRTPFGSGTVSVPETPPQRQRPKLPLHLVKIEEKGDTVTFNQRTPFGQKVWSKKFADLSDEERELLDRYRAAEAQKAAGSQAEGGDGRQKNPQPAGKQP